MRKASHVSKSRTAGVYTTLSKNISPLFDVLNIAVAEEYKRKPASVAHCDCLQSNEVFFETKFEVREGEDRFKSYSMVPVTPVDGACPYCGHTVFFSPPIEYNRAKACRRRAQEKKQKHKGKPRVQYAVRATNINTNEVIIFESMQKAYRKFGARSRTLDTGVANSLGWKFEKVIP